jgi:Tol biopolymer transport system component
MLAALLATVPAAEAAYPGLNGKIAFARGGQIWTIDPDGTDATQLTTASAQSGNPHWSPDGTRIAYTRESPGGPEVRVINADGSGDVQAIAPPAFSPTWSPNGKRLAYVTKYFDNIDCFCDIYEIRERNLDGTQGRSSLFTNPDISGSGAVVTDELAYSPAGNRVAFTTYDNQLSDRDIYSAGTAPGAGGSFIVPGDAAQDQMGLAWSPSAGKVAYLEGLNTSFQVVTITPGGTDKTTLPVDAFLGVEWSPDASKLVFAGPDATCGGCFELQTMNPDGTGRATVAHMAGEELAPDWQPVTTATPGAYPRPKGATPIRLSLVPAYQPCTAPNRTHGPPLAFGSCAPPDETSDERTVGTPEANGAAANMIGSLRIEAVVGNAATSADEADIAIRFSVTDVRCRSSSSFPCTNANAAGGTDYAGSVYGKLSLRITDRYNLPAPAGQAPGTMTDRPLTFRAECLDNSDTSIGSTCSQTTTLDALYPAMVTEGDRAVVSVTGAEVSDTEFGLPFLRPGVFVP